MKNRYDLNVDRPLPEITSVEWDGLPEPYAGICERNHIKLRVVRAGPNIKIWPASAVIARAIERIERGDHPWTNTITDSTSGNFGEGLAVALKEVRARYPHVSLKRVVAVIPKDLQPGKVARLEAHGIELVRAENSVEAMRLVEELAHKYSWLYARQYWDETNPDSYGRVAEHNAEQCPQLGVFACGAGSGGAFYKNAQTLRIKLAPRKVHRVAVAVAPGESVGGVRTEVGHLLNGKPGFPWRTEATDVCYVGLELSLKLSAALWPQGILCGESTGFALAGGLLSVLQLEATGKVPEFLDDEGNLQFLFLEHDHRDPYREDFERFGYTW